MMVDSARYRDGERLDVGERDLRQLRAKARDEGGFVWVSVVEPTESEIGELARTFDLHPLAIEGAIELPQRPTLENYDRATVLVLKTLTYDDELDAVETGQVIILMGGEFVLTICRGDSSDLRGARQYLESRQECSHPGPQQWCTPSPTLS
jgi:magnesium transporter